jgi:hypothetical protein
MKDFFRETLVIDDIYVRRLAYFNFPYYYQEFRSEIYFRPILEEVSNNKSEDIEILRTLAGCIKHLFEAADKGNNEEDFPHLRKLYESLLVRNDPIIIQQNCDSISVCLPFLKRFSSQDESMNDESPHSVKSDNFTTAASVLTPSNNQKKITRK